MSEKDANFGLSLQVHGTAIRRVTHDKYLGDFIASTIQGEDGCNSSNVKYRKSKGIGINSRIMTLLQSISLGHHYIEIAITIRESMMVGGVLFNSEVWYNLTQYNIEDLEDLDKSLLRRVMSTQISCLISGIYLELGLVPLRYALLPS